MTEDGEPRFKAFRILKVFDSLSVNNKKELVKELEDKGQLKDLGTNKKKYINILHGNPTNGSIFENNNKYKKLQGLYRRLHIITMGAQHAHTKIYDEIAKKKENKFMIRILSKLPKSRAINSITLYSKVTDLPYETFNYILNRAKSQKFDKEAYITVNEKNNKLNSKIKITNAGKKWLANASSSAGSGSRSSSAGSGSRSSSAGSGSRSSKAGSGSRSSSAGSGSRSSSAGSGS